MDGTIDDPPIVLRQSRIKLTLPLLGCAGFAVFACWSLWSGSTKNVFLGYVGLLFFAGGAIAFGRLLANPGMLTLDQTGLIWQTGWRTLRYEWSDFAHFVVYSPRWPMKAAAGIFSAHSARNGAGRAFTRGLGSFGGFWEIGASAMVTVLNEAHERWGAAIAGSESDAKS